MNILFVYPKYPDTFWSFKHILSFVSKKAAFPPLGLMTISSLLPKEWNKKLIDVNIRDVKDEYLDWADMVFVSAMLTQKEDAKNIIRRAKEKGNIVVAGGPLFTTSNETFDGVDHLILGEAEDVLPNFLADLKNGNPQKIYKCKNKPDIKNSPIPDWSLINMKEYVTMPVQYSRGCPFNCEFCDIIVMNGRIQRTKSPEQIVNEFQALYDTGWRGGVFIVDDNFIGNKFEVKKMLPEIIRWQKSHKYPFSLFTEASVNLADDKELMKMMSLANFYKVFLGIETPCEASLRESGKLQNVSRDLAESVKIIQGYGMQVLGGFIVGFDNDNASIFDAQINFIQKVGIVTAMVGLLQVLPQTRLWKRLNTEGRLITGDSSGENTDSSLNFVPKMGKEALIKGYHRILETLYSHKVYYKRINTFLKNYKPSVKTRLTKEDVSAFLKSMWRIGVLSKARFYYWILMSKTILFRRKKFAVAVELSIMGLHFDRIVKKNLAVV